MKSCPYCAESIQEAAVKCRHCNEWLDPDRRPPWSVDVNTLGQALLTALGHGAGTAEEAPPELGVPMPRSVPNWDEESGDGEAPETVRRVTTKLFGGQPVQQLDVQPPEPEPEPEPAPLEPAPAPEEPALPQGETWSTPAWLSPGSGAAATAASEPATDEVTTASGDRATLEDVALRMERIKASAAVVRDALRTQESGAPAEDVPEASDSIRSALVAEPPPPPAAPQEEPPAPEPAAEPEPAEPPKSKAAAFAEGFFSEDSGLVNADSVIGDAGDASMTMGTMMAAPRPVPWRQIISAAVVVSIIGMFTFRAQLFGDEPEEEPVAAEPAKEAPPAPVPAKAEPTPPPAEPLAMGAGAGQPVEPAAGEEPAGDAKASEAPAGTPAPLAPEELERLDEARKLYKRQKLTKARDILAELLEDHPKQPDALLLMAQVQLEKAELDDSLDTASRCVEIDPQLADCWLTIGVLQQELKEKDEAIAAYEKYLALAPDGSYARQVKTQLKRLNK